VNDCGDNSDEFECDVRECDEGKRKCADGKTCKPEASFCDRYKDCADASDENNCEGVYVFI
jgi:hypothetical protein